MSDARPAAPRDHAWVTSSYSGDNGGGGCVSIAALREYVAIRDSKQQTGPTALVPTDTWATFIHSLRTGRLGPL
ncbi:DUF397 domain-containing protein [Streptomyces sp. NPDC001407]|uniref:DUF397 domain-containing protein n=1 Tax=unclassified Streptomyces TaxID=2593676 RepID=UPI0036B7BA7F